MKPQSGEAMTKLGSRLINGFLDPASMPVDASIRAGEDRDRVHREALQIHAAAGGKTNPKDFEDISNFHFGLGPKEAGILRKAWWVASVLDGLPMTRHESYIMALVRTGKDYGVLKCHMEATYFACSTDCSARSVMDSQEWGDQWTYPAMDAEDMDAYDFRAFEQQIWVHGALEVKQDPIQLRATFFNSLGLPKAAPRQSNVYRHAPDLGGRARGLAAFQKTR